MFGSRILLPGDCRGWEKRSTVGVATLIGGRPEQGTRARHVRAASSETCAIVLFTYVARARST